MGFNLQQRHCIHVCDVKHDQPEAVDDRLLETLTVALDSREPKLLNQHAASYIILACASSPSPSLLLSSLPHPPYPQAGLAQRRAYRPCKKSSCRKGRAAGRRELSNAVCQPNAGPGALPKVSRELSSVATLQGLTRYQLQASTCQESLRILLSMTN